jgi:hypothetical protein
MEWHKTVTFTVCPAANFAMLSIGDSTPPWLVTDHTLWFVIRFVRKNITFHNYEILSCKLFTIERVVACTRIMTAVDFAGYLTFTS